jgi:hypothetical protein
VSLARRPISGSDKILQRSLWPSTSGAASQEFLGQSPGVRGARSGTRREFLGAGAWQTAHNSTKSDTSDPVRDVGARLPLDRKLPPSDPTASTTAAWHSWAAIVRAC